MAAPPQFQSLVNEFHDVFEAPSALAPGQVTPKTDLLDELFTLPRQRVYRMSPAELAESHQQIDDMLAKGQIQPSTSPYSAPLLFVRKKASKLLMCIYYHMLNKQTRLDKFLIPRIDDLLDKLAIATIFIKIDLSNAYHQVPIEEGHKFKTAFQTSVGLYEWLVLPLGLCNTPATFQQLMHDVFPPGQHSFVIVYLDDILIFSQDKDQYYEPVKYVLEQLHTHGLKAKAKKTELCLDQVEYLGHIIQNGTVRADPGKVAAITEWPVPSDVKQLQSFLGLANYYNRFICRFAHIAAPLMSLMQKHVAFMWGQEQRQAFDELKILLTTTPVLQIANFDYNFVLEMDAFAFAIGAALMQDKSDGLQPVAYFSKKLSDTEMRYAPHKVKQLAIVSLFDKFQPYVECRRTTVKTDHRPLIHVKTQPYLSNRQILGAQKLGHYNYTVEYKHGITNVAANVLSRRLDLQVRKAKFVHFGDQHGLPLAFSHIVDQNVEIRTKFERAVRLARGLISNSTKCTIVTDISIPAPQIGIKNGDREFFQWYLSRVAPHLPFQQVMESVEFSSIHDL